MTAAGLKRLLLIIALLGAACAVKASDEVESEYMRAIERADSAIAVNDYRRAVELLHVAMRLEPGNPGNIMLLSNEGMLYYYMGDDSLALATLDMAHSMAPASVTVLLNRATVNNAVGNYTQAYADYLEVTQRDSTLYEPWLQMGMLQLRGGDVRGAETSLAQAATLEPDAEEVLSSQALLYSRTNRPSEAIPFLNKLIKRSAQSEYYAERALCYLRLDDLASASEDIADGLKLDPDNADLYEARSLLNKRRYREKDAQADLQKARQLRSGQR